MATLILKGKRLHKIDYLEHLYISRILNKQYLGGHRGTRTPDIHNVNVAL